MESEKETERNRVREKWRRMEGEGREGERMEEEGESGERRLAKEGRKGRGENRATRREE